MSRKQVRKACLDFTIKQAKNITFELRKQFTKQCATLCTLLRTYITRLQQNRGELLATLTQQVWGTSGKVMTAFIFADAAAFSKSSNKLFNSYLVKN